MVVQTKKINVKTKGELHIMNITEEVQSALKESNLNDGIATIFVSGSTAALTTIEYEPGLLEDFPNMLERVAPKDIEYAHEERWHDGNGHSHVRASLVGPSLTVPFNDKQLTLGTWQQIVLIELDIRSRSRNLILQLIGE